VRVDNVNVVSITRSNLEVVLHVNELIAVSDLNEAVDVVEVGAGVDVALVSLIDMMSEARN
jgi:xanthine dehydrogenase iron-sulfur cluster and FAD-binding subunit A